MASHSQWVPLHIVLRSDLSYALQEFSSAKVVNMEMLRMYISSKYIVNPSGAPQINLLTHYLVYNQNVST